MGVAGRDYMRSTTGGGSGWRPGRLTWWIIGINGVLWFIFSSGLSRRPSDLGLFMLDELMLHPEQVFASGKIWQLFTSFWLHDWNSAGHVFWNMLILFFFGRMAEGSLGPRGYLRLYLLGGLVASVIYTGYSYLTGAFIPALGASGAVYAVLVWVACMHPKRTVYLMFFLPMPMWVAVGVLMVGVEVLSLTQNLGDAGSAVAHLAGAAWGFVYFRWFPRWHGTRGAGGWMVKLKRKREA
ncbi:MAG: rhomboid family intramembrane serine protease, partial [Planctomycetota bacterium]|nr:rhomboid family intramembrane serine protease [Planctomycetota bacterium]